MAKYKLIILFLMVMLVGCAEQPIQDANEINKVLAYKPKPALAATKPTKPVTPQSPKSAVTKKAVYYTVEKGDTLYSIGFRSGFGYWKLAEWNNIPAPYTLHVGQQLKFFDSKAQGEAATPLPKVEEKYTASSVSAVQVEKSTISKDKQKLLKLYWQWPIRGRILKSFARTSNKGIDIDCEYGQSIEAAADGEIVYSGNAIKAYGNLLIIKHDDVYLSAYANNELLMVKEGQKVKQGQKIASCGKAAYGVAALHFEIRKNGKSVNPLVYLPG